MKIFTLAYFDACEWGHMVARVRAEDPQEAKKLLIERLGSVIIRRAPHSNEGADWHGPELEAPPEIMATWIKVEGEQEAPDKGVLSIAKRWGG